MTTQRDRLATLIHAVECGCTEEGIGPEAVAYETADALLARGVRVVDVDTLSRALLEAAVGGPGIRAEAEAIVVALDAAE